MLLGLLLQDVSDKYNSLLDLVGRGPTPYGERLANTVAMESFFLRRGKEEVKAMFPVSEQVRHARRLQCVWLHACVRAGFWAVMVLLLRLLRLSACQQKASVHEATLHCCGYCLLHATRVAVLSPSLLQDQVMSRFLLLHSTGCPCSLCCLLSLPACAVLQEAEAVSLASKLEDKAWALEQLLGPTLQPEGSSNRLKSQEARAITEHLYSPDRYSGSKAAHTCMAALTRQSC